mgnify:CR=1 FL=1
MENERRKQGVFYIAKGGNGNQMEFTLRPWQQRDCHQLCRYANNEKIAANLQDGFPYPYRLADAEAYIAYARQADPEREMIYAIVVANQAVGSISVQCQQDVHCKTAALGYWLGEPFWGNGIMSAAVKRVSQLAFETFDICRIFAEIYSHNIASRRVVEKAGYQMEGLLRRNIYKNGAVFDSCIYALVR